MFGSFSSIVSIIAVVCFGSCAGGDQSRSDREVLTFSDTTWKDGKAELYDALGRLTDRIAFKDGVRHGWHEHFRENGTIEYRNKYHQGQRGGTSIAYYPNGNVEVRSYWLDGKQFGQTVWFATNGSDSLRGYYDFHGRGFCSARYSTTEPTAAPLVEGLAVSPDVWDYPRLDSLPSGDTSTVQLAISTFPNMYTSIACWLDDMPLRLSSIDSSMAIVMISSNEPGDHMLRVEGTIRDTQQTIRAENQFSVKVVVVPR